MNINQSWFIYIHMDYKTILREHLLSKTNIDYMINLVFDNFKINKKAIDKCRNIVINNMTRYLEYLEQYPENDSQLIEAINYLNKKCYEDFSVYLSTKYPNKNINRQTQPIACSNVQPSPSYPTEQCERQISCQPTEIIITSEEKDLLLKKHGISNTKQKSTDDVLSYLSNPMFLQMFSLMISQLNQSDQYSQNDRSINSADGVILCKEQVLDLITSTQAKSKQIEEIIDINQVKELLTAKPKPRSDTIVSPNNKETLQQLLTAKPKSHSDSTISLNNKETLQQSASDDISQTTNDLDAIDLDNLNSSTLKLVVAKIKDLTNLKEKYLSENNKEMIEKIDGEKANILNAVIMFKKKIKTESNVNSDTIDAIDVDANQNISKSVSSNVSKLESDDPNVDILNLQFDPTNDYNDVKDIMIRFNSEKKIKEINLISYHLPFNPNNVTRFNNKFIVHFNNRISNIVIPPGKYDEIDLLLTLIKNQVTFLDFSVDTETKIITIKNALNMKFDLMLFDGVIFSLLGFTEKADTYKGELSYQASRPYNLETNSKVYFSLAGSTKDPIELKFNEQTNLTKPILLKKVNSNVSFKQMKLNLTNSIEQYYDFTKPFKMCFSIIYHNVNVAK